MPVHSLSLHIHTYILALSFYDTDPTSKTLVYKSKTRKNLILRFPIFQSFVSLKVFSVYKIRSVFQSNQIFVTFCCKP